MYTKSPRASTKAQNTSKYAMKQPANQSRIRQRLSSSPLKLPLENAINKALTPRDTNQKYNSQSRILMKSRLKQERDHSTSRIISRNIYKDQPQLFRQKMHTQTMSFLKKYFNGPVEVISADNFIQCIIRQYEHLWGTQNSGQIFEDFNYKIYELFSENINIRDLVKKTLNDGMIGLILEIFKQIKNQQRIRTSSYLTVSKNPKIINLKSSFQQQLSNNYISNTQNLQNIKNVVQEFMQTMYQCMQSQIYNKFNVQMRRMVVKFRQAQRLMKRVNQKINSHADIFQYQALFREKKKQYQQVIEKYRKQNEELARQLYRQKNNCELERRQNYKLQQQNKKLKQNLQKFQNAVLSKVLEPSPFMDTTLSRKYSSNSMLCEKQNSYPSSSNININPSNLPQQPIKITIDTHVIQKDGQPPQTKTYATIYNLGNLTKQTSQTIQTPITTQSRLIDNYGYNFTPTPSTSAYDYKDWRTSPIHAISRRL